LISRWYCNYLIDNPDERQRLGLVPIRTTGAPVLNRGKRLIILNAMDEDGFIKDEHGESLMWTNVSDGMLSDYHKDMNTDTFEDYMWFLCLILRNNGVDVLIIDNASYHTRKHDPPPTRSATYATMTSFCDAHGIVYPANLAISDRKVRVVGRYVRLYEKTIIVIVCCWPDQTP